MSNFSARLYRLERFNSKLQLLQHFPAKVRLWKLVLRCIKCVDFLMCSCIIHINCFKVRNKFSMETLSKKVMKVIHAIVNHSKYLCKMNLKHSRNSRLFRYVFQRITQPFSYKIIKHCVWFGVVVVFIYYFFNIYCHEIL